MKSKYPWLETMYMSWNLRSKNYGDPIVQSLRICVQKGEWNVIRLTLAMLLLFNDGYDELGIK